MPETSGAEVLDAEREAQGYNQSIYLMAGMPYLLLGGLGLLIYRVYRRRPRELPQQAALGGAGNGGIGHVLPSLQGNASEDLNPGRSVG